MPMLFSSVILLVLCISAISIASTVFWIWMAVDCVMNKRISDTQKAWWVVLIIFTHFIGALIYFFAGRSRQPKQSTYQYYVQPQAPQPYNEAPRESAYRPYAQGYQPPPQQPVPPIYQNNDVSPVNPEREQMQRQSPDYEQPQAMYPHESE